MVEQNDEQAPLGSEEVVLDHKAWVAEAEKANRALSALLDAELPVSVSLWQTYVRKILDGDGGMGIPETDISVRRVEVKTIGKLLEHLRIERLLECTCGHPRFEAQKVEGATIGYVQPVIAQVLLCLVPGAVPPGDLVSTMEKEADKKVRATRKLMTLIQLALNGV